MVERKESIEMEEINQVNNQDNDSKSEDMNQGKEEDNTSSYEKVVMAMKDSENFTYEDLDITLWVGDDFVTEKSVPPFYMIVNDYEGRFRTCSVSKRLGYNIAKYVYSHNDIKDNIEELRFNSGGVTFNLMQEDGLGITNADVWSGPTNFWKTFETTGLNSNLGEGRTWGIAGPPQC